MFILDEYAYLTPLTPKKKPFITVFMNNIRINKILILIKYVY